MKILSILPADMNSPDPRCAAQAEGPATAGRIALGNLSFLPCGSSVAGRQTLLLRDRRFRLYPHRVAVSVRLQA